MTKEEKVLKNADAARELARKALELVPEDSLQVGEHAATLLQAASWIIRASTYSDLEE